MNSVDLAAGRASPSDPVETVATTVVVVALLGGAATEQCVNAIRQSGANYVVVDQSGGCFDASGRILKRGSGATSVPARRRLGLEVVTTPYVAFLEDTVLPDVTWLKAVAPVLSQPGVAGVGGPVRIADALKPACRALGLCEYGRFQPAWFMKLATGDRTPGGEAAVCALPGANFAFRTQDLRAAMPQAGDIMIDNEIFERLRDNGLLLAFAPAMAVTYAQRHDAGARLSTRYIHGRIYASRLRSSKLMTATKALMLPLVLFARSFREATPSMRRDVATMFWVAAQHIAWSAGEFVGAIFGAARGDLEHWN